MFCQNIQIYRMNGWWSKGASLVLLILIFSRLSFKVERATVAVKDVSDDGIDTILRDSIEQWDSDQHDMGQYNSTMTDWKIGLGIYQMALQSLSWTDFIRLFVGIDSRKFGELVFRFQKRLEFVTRTLTEEKHMKHMTYVHTARRNTEI